MGKLNCMKKTLALISWLIFTGSTLFLALAFYFNLNQVSQPIQRPQIAYSATEGLASRPVLPEVLGAFTFSVKTADAIPEIVKSYLKKYDSPLMPEADYLIATAQKYNLDPRLLVAIAQQESNLCKKIPDESYNCWGWGIHSEGTLKFSSYEEAIEAVSKGLYQNYIRKGLTTPEEIMSIYTPLSEGSWAKGVQQFLNEME